MIDVLSKLETITKLLGGGGRQVGGNPGEQWAGGVPRREKKGRDAGSLRWPEAGEKLKKGKLSLFVTAYIQSKKRTQQRFLTSI